MLMKNQILHFIESLKQELNHHNYRYYVLNKPVISDYDFDMKMKLLEKLESKILSYCDINSPNNKIGGYVDHNFKTIKHTSKMYSLKNIYSITELNKWINNIKKKINYYDEYICEPKYDGVSISLIYKDGYFNKAITRGDGTYGDDVTHNVILIDSIPLKLNNIIKGYTEFRGEIIISNDNFNKLNQQQLKNSKNIYSNARNIVSGTLKLKNNLQEFIKRSLDCVIYYIRSDEINFLHHNESLNYARKCGLKIPHISLLCKNSHQIKDLIKSWNICKNKIPYKTDGIVIKLNNCMYYDNLGYSSKYPNWSIAYKFPSTRVSTNILHIYYQISKFGKITPIAYINPLFIDGTLIKKVCLYNKNYIENYLQLHYNDEVVIEKGGEIIPKINKINLHKRTKKSYPVVFIDKCPSCNSKLYNNNHDVYCLNANYCPDQLIAKLSHFVSRKCMNINCLGSQTLTNMFNNKIIQHLPDLYKIDIDKLYNIENIGIKLANKIVNNISNSKNTPFHKVLFSLSIPNLGEETSHALVSTFYNINNIINASFNQLIKINNIGNKVAKSILKYFDDINNIRVIEDLKSIGLQFSITKQNIYRSKFRGKKFLFTGKLNNLTRSRVKELVREHGGLIYNKINNKLNFLIVGNNPGSKLKLCRNIQTVKILNEDEFIKYFNIN
jgi:DNA ligase (NAD+)